MDGSPTQLWHTDGDNGLVGSGTTSWKGPEWVTLGQLPKREKETLIFSKWLHPDVSLLHEHTCKQQMFLDWNIHWQPDPFLPPPLSSLPPAQRGETTTCRARKMREGRMGLEVWKRLKTEGTYVYLWPIYVDVWQKPTQYGKAIILQLKLNKFLKKSKGLPPFLSLE